MYFLKTWNMLVRLSPFGGCLFVSYDSRLLSQGLVEVHVWHVYVIYVNGGLK